MLENKNYYFCFWSNRDWDNLKGSISKNYINNYDYRVFTKSIFPEIFKEIAQECYMGSVESFTKLFEDKEFYRLMMEEVGKEVYRKLKNK
jgi:type I restriction enzyme R subunit